MRNIPNCKSAGLNYGEIRYNCVHYFILILCVVNPSMGSTTNMLAMSSFSQSSRDVIPVDGANLLALDGADLPPDWPWPSLLPDPSATIAAQIKKEN